MQLYEHQKKVLALTKGRNRVAYYLDMGLGKTFVGSEKVKELDSRLTLVVCQKSKVSDWIEHFETYYPGWTTIDLTRWKKSEFQNLSTTNEHTVYIINYDLVFRRPELITLKGFTLMLDESSLICNERAKRSKAILAMKPENVILLSGTPTAGKYEKLWSQCRLLGWWISKEIFWSSYIITKWIEVNSYFHQEIVVGYKNINHLKQNLTNHGAVFMKTEEVLSLPKQVEQVIYLKPTTKYRQFEKYSEVTLEDGTQLIGTTLLTQILYQRQLCGQYHKEKLEAFKDLLESTEDHLVVFYSYTRELKQLEEIAIQTGRKTGQVNGKRKDTTDGIGILFVQYQAGAYGLNLQGFSNKIIYYTLPLGRGSCDLWEQSKKRIHRIGQEKTCFYYYLIVKDSIETKNLSSLKKGKDYTDFLFE